MSDWLSRLAELRTLSAGAVYVVLLGFVFVESGLLVGFFLPGDSVLFTAGLLAAEPGSPLSLPLLAGGVFLAAVAGDAVGYVTGRRLGRPWLLQRAGRAARVDQAERFYARYGWWAIVVARFIPWVRTFTPIVAGVARMPYRRFTSANVVGAACWGSGLVGLGYLGHSVPWIKWAAYTVAGTAIGVSIVAPVVGWARSRRVRGAHPDVLDGDPASSPNTQPPPDNRPPHDTRPPPDNRPPPDTRPAPDTRSAPDTRPPPDTRPAPDGPLLHSPRSADPKA